MIFTWTETVSFFAAVLLAGWLIFPNRYFQGLMQRQEGDRSVSIAFFKDYLDENPSHKGAVRALASVFESVGRPEEALEVELAFYRKRRGDRETGKRVLELLERSASPERVRAFRWELLDDIRRRPGEKRGVEELAYQAYQDAAAAQDDPGVSRALGILESAAAQPKGYQAEALRHFIVRRDFTGALRLLEKAASQAPSDPETRRLIVRVHRMNHDPKAALRALELGLKAVPEDPGLLADRAAVHGSLGLWDAAAEDFVLLGKLQPSEETWVKDLGYALLQAGRLEEGVKVYQGLLDKAPGEAARWRPILYAYADRRMHAEASRWAERFLERFPDDESGIDLGVYQSELLGRPDKAIEILARRAARRPSDTRRGRSLASLLTQEERLGEAALVYERLLARESEDKALWMNLAYLHSSTGAYSEAASVLERFVEKFPDDSKGYDELASIYLSMGERKKAISLLKTYFKAPPAAAKGPPTK